MAVKPPITIEQLQAFVKETDAAKHVMTILVLRREAERLRREVDAVVMPVFFACFPRLISDTGEQIVKEKDLYKATDSEESLVNDYYILRQHALVCAGLAKEEDGESCPALVAKMAAVRAECNLRDLAGKRLHPCFNQCFCDKDHERAMELIFAAVGAFHKSETLPGKKP
jgi:hypothetical protein